MDQPSPKCLFNYQSPAVEVQVMIPWWCHNQSVIEGHSISTPNFARRFKSMTPSIALKCIYSAWRIGVMFAYVTGQKNRIIDELIIGDPNGPSWISLTTDESGCRIVLQDDKNNVVGLSLSSSGPQITLMESGKGQVDITPSDIIVDYGRSKAMLTSDNLEFEAGSDSWISIGVDESPEINAKHLGNSSAMKLTPKWWESSFTSDDGQITMMLDVGKSGAGTIIVKDENRNVEALFAGE